MNLPWVRPMRHTPSQSLLHRARLSKVSIASSSANSFTATLGRPPPSSSTSLNRFFISEQFHRRKNANVAWMGTWQSQSLLHQRTVSQRNQAILALAALRESQSLLHQRTVSQDDGTVGAYV